MAGQRLGRYQILSKLGAGGMGEVFRAHDLQLDRDVALKLLPGSVSSDRVARKRLLSEAQAASGLNHPNICIVYEAGEIEEQVYLAMEYVEGSRLADLIHRNQLAPDRIISYGRQLADALGHAHDRGIVHRDLKTSNVIITPQDRLKLLDFGLATRTAVFAATADGSTISIVPSQGMGGTLAYVAPEILLGGSTNVCSDIWSFGIVLYEMAFGKRPYDGRTPYELASEILHQNLPCISIPTVPGLAVIVQRCLEKNVALRYQNTNEIRSALEAIQAASQGTTSGDTVQPAHRWVRVWDKAKMLVALIAVGAPVLWFAVDKLESRHTVVPQIRSVAVLPFENLSANPDQAYFAEGMTDELITELGSISALKISSRVSADQFRRTHEKLSTIGRELNVDGVVQGSVLQAGDRVRLTVQLAQAATDRILWARSYERDLQNVLQLQEELAIAIATQLKAEITPRENVQLSNARKVNPESYQLYLKGRSLWNLRSRESLEKAQAIFLEAINKDPSSAQAYCGLADTYTLLQNYDVLAPDEAYPLARRAALKAIELDPNLAEAHNSLAATLQDHEKDWIGAEREYKRAIELNPSYSTAHQWYGTLLSVLGRSREAILEEKQARELAPLSPRTAVDLGYALFHARRYDEAVEQARKVLDLDPNLASAHELLGRALLSKGSRNEAINEFQIAGRLAGNRVTDQALLAYALAKTGQASDAGKILLQLKEIPVSSAPYYHIAMIHVALGQPDEALMALEDSARWQHDKWPSFLKVEEAFEPLGEQPRYHAILRHFRLE